MPFISALSGEPRIAVMSNLSKSLKVIWIPLKPALALRASKSIGAESRKSSSSMRKMAAIGSSGSSSLVIILRTTPMSKCKSIVLPPSSIFSVSGPSFGSFSRLSRVRKPATAAPPRMPTTASKGSFITYRACHPGLSTDSNSTPLSFTIASMSGRSSSTHSFSPET